MTTDKVDYHVPSKIFFFFKILLRYSILAISQMWVKGNVGQGHPVQITTNAYKTSDMS